MESNNNDIASNNVANSVNFTLLQLFMIVT